jgi:O-antigen/teichoic acid export membrane protein
MGFIQKDALRTTIINYLGLVLGYINKGILFVFILSTEEIGLINLLLSVGLLFAQLANLGSVNAIIKFLPFFKDNPLQKNGFLWLNLFFVFAGILLFTSLVILLQNYIVEFYSVKSALFVKYYFWIIPIGIANVFFLVFESYLRAIYKNILSVFVYEFLLRLLVTILLFCLWFKAIDFNSFLILHATIYFIPSLILLIYLFKLNEISFKKVKFYIPSKFKKIIISFSLFSYTNSIGSLIVATIDALMIAYYLGLKETGIYTTMIYISSALLIPYKSIIRISSPLIPQYWKEKNMVEMKSLYQKVSSISLISILFFFSLVWVNRIELFSFLPKEFYSGIWVFFFVMLGKIVDSYFGLNGYILVTSKKFKYDILFTIFLVFLVYFLNVFLIPIYGMNGAAISTGLSIVLFNFFRMIFVKVVYKIHPFKLQQFKIIFLFGLIMCFFEFISFDFTFNLIQIGIKSCILILFFFTPIILLNLEPELNVYLKNIKTKLLKK